MTARERGSVLWVCDIDGVLNGYEPTCVEAAWGVIDRPEVMLPSRGRIARYELRVAPRLIDRIEALRREYRIEWVWQTTWCEGDRVPFFTDALGGRLEGGRMLPMPAREEGLYLPFHWRLEGLVADVKRSRPAAVIWTDDEISYDYEVRMADIDVPYLALRPNEFSGLVPDDLTRIETFLKRHGIRR